MTAAAIKANLKRLNKNQAWLAFKLGISESRLSLIINNHFGDDHKAFARIDRILIKEESCPTTEFSSLKLRDQLKKIGKKPGWLARELAMAIEEINILLYSQIDNDCPDSHDALREVIQKEADRLNSQVPIFRKNIKLIGKKQCWLAWKVSISDSWMSLILSGKAKGVDTSVLAKIERVLDAELRRIARLTQ